MAEDISAARLVPFWLPASHFAAGLLSLLAAALLTPFIATDIAAGRFLQPQVVAVTHLVTLGWLTVSIMGALCQLFPVVLGTPLRSISLATLTLLLFVPGLGVFVTGLLSGRTALTVGGAVAFATALVMFLVNAGATLSRARKRDLTWWSLAAAFFFLASTITYGISLAVNLRTGHLQAQRLEALAVHVHVALGGWVLLVIMAVARRLLPMFLLSHGTHELPLRIAVACMTAGALLMTLLHRMLTHATFVASVLLMGIGVLALGVQVAGYVRSRHRPQLDAGLRLVMAGGVLVLATLPLGTAILLGRTSMSVITAYGTAAVGGLALFVAGHYYKIIPFLLWNHRFAPLVGKRPLPKISELYSQRAAALAAASSSVGMYALVAAALMRAPLVAGGAGLLLTIGILTQAAQLLRLLRTRPV